MISTNDPNGIPPLGVDLNSLVFSTSISSLYLLIQVQASDVILQDTIPYRRALVFSSSPVMISGSTCVNAHQ
ncbi:Hypothetical predicted protein [Olea europaea subsp. europaea]|uniref:Uncharacterized protein n=1 Tax=Olea europaea subsp. europaea TaxID=158383 RepID=A0A8S0UR46_OLEEU|nr:Hypothetical predicted protein [Olea europaea subsp. europaea]